MGFSTGSLGAKEMSNWKNSIVTYMDLIGIKDVADEGRSRATDLMRSMHSLVDGNMNHGMRNHDHCYIWNDSVLLLSHIDSPYRNAGETEILKEADSLKKKIDEICSCYAISVKGQVFPEESYLHAPVFDGQIGEQSRVVRLKASSYAMGNCFIIEDRLGKKLKKPWYVDSRIAKKLNTNQNLTKHRVKMLPKNITREIYVYEGYLW